MSRGRKPNSKESLGSGPDSEEGDFALSGFTIKCGEFSNYTGRINAFLPRRLEDIEDTKVFLYFSSCLRALRVLRG